jgi:hypothetical protein
MAISNQKNHKSQPWAHTRCSPSNQSPVNEDQKNEALDLLKVGVKPKNLILRLMNQEDRQNLTSRAVYNLKQNNDLNDLSSLQKLLQELDRDDWVQHYTVDENNAVNAIFFAQKWSINLCRRFNKAIVMDCTYQTNKYKLNLLNFSNVFEYHVSHLLCISSTRKCKLLLVGIIKRFL